MGGGSLMVWVAVGYNNKSQLVFCESKMNQYSYIDILQQNIFNKGEELAGFEWIFMQDNASIHKAHSVKNWFSEKNINVLD